MSGGLARSAQSTSMKLVRIGGFRFANPPYDPNPYPYPAMSVSSASIAFVTCPMSAMASTDFNIPLAK